VQGFVDLVACPFEGLAFCVHDLSALSAQFDATVVARRKPGLNISAQKQLAITKA
jgi:hypothetical protein